MKEKINAWFDTHADEIEGEIIRLTTEMCRQKTVNVITAKLSEHPYLKIRGEEWRVADIVKQTLNDWGIPWVEHARTEGRPNVIGTFGPSNPKKTLLMAAHMDIVPAGDGWNTDPFEPVLKDGYLFGRGVLDNKGPLASILLAAKALKEIVDPEHLTGAFQIAALSDEEAMDADGIDYGIEYLLEEKLISPTYAIIPDVGENMQLIDIAEKGSIVIKISSQGKQAHGSTPEKGVNAVYAMARLIPLLETWQPAYTPHPLLKKPSVNLGEISGGVAPNIVPGDCSIMLDIRIVPGQTVEALLAEIDQLIQQVEGSFTVEVIAASDPHAITPNNVLVKSIQTNSATCFGVTPEPFGMSGATFAKTLNQFGITAVGFGPGDDDAFHVANESVEIKQLMDFARLTVLTALDLLTD